MITVESGLYDRYNTVISKQNICSLDGVQLIEAFGGDDSNSASCPAPGRYVATTSFTVPTTRDYDFHYTPDLRLDFVDEHHSFLGCATTGTRAQHRYSDQHAQRGMTALGVAVLIFCGLFGTLLYLSYRRKQRSRILRMEVQN